jgi:hypothetical protein
MFRSRNVDFALMFLFVKSNQIKTNHHCGSFGWFIDVYRLYRMLRNRAMPDPKKNPQTSGFKTFIIPSNINPISIRILSESPWNLFRSGPSNGCSPGILLYLGWRGGHTGCTKWFLYTIKQNNYINYMMEKDNGFPSCLFCLSYYHLVL